MSYYALKENEMPVEDWNNFDDDIPTHMDGPTDKEIEAARKRADSAEYFKSLSESRKLDSKMLRAINRNPEVFHRIVDHVEHARTKHPNWLKRDDFVLSVAEMEWDEFRHALQWETRHRAQEEALDLIAVLIRFIEGDAD